jgi:hypothetical protein
VTFERPWLLALLVAVPIAWWIHRSKSGAPVVRVASLLAFRGASATTPSSAPRAALDWRIAFVLAAMTLLALGASGPAIGASRGEAFYVVVDGSASMSARTCDAAERAERLLREAAPGAERVDRALRPPGAPDGLPESLAPHLDDARRRGFPGVVLVTDAPVAAMPGVAVIGPSAGAAANVSIASVTLDGDEAVVALRNHGAAGVVAQVRSGGASRDVEVPGGGIGTVRFPAPSPGEKAPERGAGPRRGPPAAFEIVSPADDLAADDRITVERRGGARRIGGELVREAHLLAALRAVDARLVLPGPWDAAVQFGGGVSPPGREPLLIVSPRNPTVLARERSRIRFDAQIGFRTVRGDEIVGRGEFADVLPSPGTTLVACGRLDGGEPIWSDPNGVLAARDGDLIVVAIDPEDPRSDWHRDPSFPAFVAAALDRLTGGPDRLDPVASVPPSESDVVRDPPRTASTEDLRAVLRRAGPVPDAVRPARWLALAAALLLLCATLVPRR